MSAQQLITEHIDLWTSTIKARKTQGRGSNKKRELYGIKKLRELILELAVRGKLVPQDSSDEPASVLLERIAAEKAQLIKDKKIKKPKLLSPISDEDEPFALPLGWEWVKLGEIGLTQTGGTPKKSDTNHYGNYMPFVKPGDIIDNSIITYNNDGLSQEGAESLGRVASDGSVLMVCIGTIGKCAFIDRDCSFNQQINSVTPYLDIGKFVHTVLSALYFQKLAWENSSSTTLSILNKGKWENIPVALAPHSEQYRIVAKVDELMALCDQLEQQTESSLDAHNLLVDTLLSTLTDARDAKELSDNWARLAEHFDTLITTDYAVEQLKQTILQLAVMGKLVPQDPNDEPASELLKRIAAEKTQLIKDKKIKKLKPLPEIGDEEKPFELPVGWARCRLQDSIDVRDGTHDSPKDANGENTFPLITSKNFIDGAIDFDSARMISAEDHFEISKRSLVEIDDILFSMIGGNIGNQVIVRDARLFSVKNVALFKYYDKTATAPNYFKIYTEELAVELQSEASGGAQPFVSLGALRKLVFSLPPINEQHRIVAKVDELMTLCDQLKSQLNDAQTIQLHLSDAVVEKAVN